MNRTKRALQVVKTDCDKFKYLDCYSKETATCSLKYNCVWVFNDDAHPQKKYKVLGKNNGKLVEPTLFQDRLPVITYDERIDLYGDGEEMCVRTCIKSILEVIDKKFDSIDDFDIIFVEEVNV